MDITELIEMFGFDRVVEALEAASSKEVEALIEEDEADDFNDYLEEDDEDDYLEEDDDDFEDEDFEDED